MLPDDRVPSPRRTFIGSVAAGAVGLVAGPLETLVAQTAPVQTEQSQDDAWLKALTGKHKQLFDGATINNGVAYLYAHTFVRTMMQHYKLTSNDVTAFVVARYTGIGLVLDDSVWQKYRLGELWNEVDPVTKAPALRNRFHRSKPGDMLNIDASVDKMLARGVVIGVCGAAIRAFSAGAASRAGVTPEVAYADWSAGIIPGVHVMPSGVLAIAIAQQAGCTYCYAG